MFSRKLCLFSYVCRRMQVKWPLSSGFPTSGFRLRSAVAATAFQPARLGQRSGAFRTLSNTAAEFDNVLCIVQVSEGIGGNACSICFRVRCSFQIVRG